MSAQSADAITLFLSLIIMETQSDGTLFIVTQKDPWDALVPSSEAGIEGLLDSVARLAPVLQVWSVSADQSDIEPLPLSGITPRLFGAE